MRDRTVTWRQLLAAGLTAALLVAAGGVAWELWRFGASPAGASARLERQVRGSFDRVTAVLSRVATGVATDPVAARALAAGPEQARDLFDLVDRRVLGAGDELDDVAATVYDAQGVARAWRGRPSDVMAPDRLAGPSAFFVTPSPLGPRLVRLVPILDTQQHRLGSVAVEHVLSPASAAATITATDVVLPTTLGPASLRMRWEGAGGEARANAFVLRAPDGEPLVEVSMTPADIERGRSAFRHKVAAASLGTLSLTLLLLMGPVLDRRAEARVGRAYFAATGFAIALLLAGALLVWGALSLVWGEAPGAPVLLLLGGVTAPAVVALLAGPAVRARIAARRRRHSALAPPLASVALQLCAGLAMAAILVAFDWLLLRAVDPDAVDLRHFSLHPW
ncbi:MAG: two-component system, NtrC family, nitrogen regulation sensor histidine kinase NtrY, partial [Acidobacteriota bacterium]